MPNRLMPRCLLESAIFAALLIPVSYAPLRAQDRFSPHIAPTDPLPAEEQLKKFRLPTGFEIQLVAAEPAVRKPINMNFDIRGRLFVTQSMEYPFPAKEGAKGRDRVSVLSQIGRDGKAKKVEVYVDGLNIPIGVAPVGEELLVYSIPELLRCADKNNNGKIDAAERKPICQGFGFRDTHGMVNNITPWIDGWVYVCHGFSNTSEAAGTDGRKIVMQSGNTFRLRPDGSEIEYFTHGQVNPFGLTFDSLGNVFSTDCHTLPAYCLIRGAWYPSFGKPHDGLGFGPPMMRHNHGSTGLAGICYYEAEQFPKEYRGTLFIGNPLTHRVNHDKLRWHGSTPEAVEQPDFLICDDPWFRPVDIQLGPDGALYVADFYNRIIGHYEVPLDHPGRDRERGRIWRIVYRGKDAKEEPPAGPVDLRRSAGPRIVPWLTHHNIAVRRMMLESVAEAMKYSPPSARKNWMTWEGEGPAEAVANPHHVRTAFLWLLSRNEMLTEKAVNNLQKDEHPQVRVHLVKAMAERRKWEGENAFLFPLIRAKLKDEDPFVRRAAADALGRHPHEDNISPLLAAWNEAPAEDTHLIHTIRIALRDHLAAQGMYGKLSEAKLTAENKPLAIKLADVSLGVKTEHAAHFLLEYLLAADTPPARFPELLHHAVRFTKKDDLPAAYLLAGRIQEWNVNVQADALTSYHTALQERGQPLPKPLSQWADELTSELLSAKEARKAERGIGLARQLGLASSFEQVAAVALGEPKELAALSPLAIDALPSIDGAKAVSPLSTVLGDPSVPIPFRQRAAASLSTVNSVPARRELVSRLKTASEQVAVEIARGLSRSKPGGEALLAAVEAGAASARLLQDRVVLDGLQRANIPQLDPRLKKLTAGLPPLDQAVAALMARRRGGFLQAGKSADISKGKLVFEKNCAACHKVGELGKKIGPELDGIGNRGLDRLLEDILDPSRNVDQAFRMTQISTTDGRSLRGLKLREEGEVVILADDKGKEVRVAKADIAEQGLARLSPMPANVPDIIREEDFYHLLQFLLHHRQKPR